MAKTMSVRMDERNYEFLKRMSEDEKADLSSAIRELVDRGRILLAVDRYRQGKASLGRATELAGVPTGEMIEILSTYGVKSSLEREDYLKGLEHPRKAW